MSFGILEFTQTEGMNVRVKFLGGSKTVTGSKYLLEIDDYKILVDCGLFQGKKELRLRNWDALPTKPEEIDVVLLTHAHIDHSGYLPRLVKDGFNKKIICTHATEDLLQILLKDAGKLQEEEAAFAFKHGYSKHSKPKPLFTEEDAIEVFHYIESYSYQQSIQLNEAIEVKFYNAGHILGASSIEIIIQGEKQSKTILFSGDLGRNHDPLMYPPQKFVEADVIFIESTYGDRVSPMADVESDLAAALNEAHEKGGSVIIPAFAVGRTQNLIFYINHLMSEKKIETVPVYIDSPMAISVTSLYERHSAIHKLKVEKRAHELISIFDSSTIKFCNTPESSRVLNDIKYPSIIISASGMCTGGRILHHLYHRLPNKDDTVLFVGFQAEGTRGRHILDGDESVRIFGIEVPIKCAVKEIQGLSAHADLPELMEWLGNFSKSPKMLFITHGEPEVAESFSNQIQSKLGWQPIVPEYLETFELFRGI